MGIHSGVLSRIKNSIDRNRLGELLVIRGKITGGDLKQILNEQKNSQKPLGQILLEKSLITRRELAFALARQTTLRTLAALMLFVCAGVGGAKKSTAQDSAPIAVSMSASAIYSGIDSYPALFGTTEKRSGNLSAFTKWNGMFGRFTRDAQTESGKKIMSDWKENIESFRGLPLRTLAERVNDFVNKKPYILDNKNWGRSDYWSTPVEFMKKGGDCEDFAIAKYVALMQLGVPENRMRLAIVQDTYKNIPHAVLTLYTDEGAIILDQQIKTIINGERPGRYKPIFTINRQAWWLHTATPTTQIASR
jgi:predicted transglutaminase-like cysteine proteinase